MQNNILVLASVDLKNPMRGTPIRIMKCIEQIADGGASVVVVARSLDEKPERYDFIPAPALSAWSRFLYLRKLLKEKKINWIFTPTTTDIKMVILLKLFCRVRVAIDIHGVSNEEAYYFGSIGYLQKIYRGVVLSLQLYFFDAIFVVSKKMLSYYGKHRARGHVLYGGVSVSDFPNCANYREAGDPTFEVTYMGNARPYQGLPILLESLKNITLVGLRLRLIISGDTREVMELLQKFELESIATIHHDVSHHEVSSLLGTTDVLVIPRPSLAMTEYAYPSKLPECIATAIPVVATDVGPVSELFTHGVHCVITKKDDTAAFGAGIMAIYKASKAERMQMGSAGRNRVVETLSWDILGETIRAVFK
jgi:glycosyltransferase involved in cell wall biosynthesis